MILSTIIITIIIIIITIITITTIIIIIIIVVVFVFFTFFIIITFFYRKIILGTCLCFSSQLPLYHRWTDLFSSHQKKIQTLRMLRWLSEVVLHFPSLVVARDIYIYVYISSPNVWPNNDNAAKKVPHQWPLAPGWTLGAGVPIHLSLLSLASELKQRHWITALVKNIKPALPTRHVMKKKGTTPCCTRLVTLLLQVCNSRPPNPNETDSLMISSHQVQNLPEPCSLTTWIHLTHLDTQRQQFWRTNISNVQLSGDSFQVAKGSSCAAPRYSATEAPRAIRPSCPEQNWIQLIHGVRTSIALSEPRLRWTSSFGSSESPVVSGHSESFPTCVSVFRHIGTSTWSCIKDTNGEMQTTDFFNTRPRIAISSVQRCRDTLWRFLRKCARPGSW